MDDPLLARARLLVAMSSAVAPAVHSASASIVPSSPPRDASPTSSPLKKTSVSGSTVQFKCSVFKGSSLITILAPAGGDIRAVIQKGMDVDIDGVEYQVSKKQFAEWSPTRFELSIDYSGESNMNACLSVQDSSRRSPKKKYAVEPIPSSDIRNALSALDSIPTAFQRRKPSEEPPAKPVRKHNSSKSMNLTSDKLPMSAFNPDPVQLKAPAAEQIFTHEDYDPHYGPPQQQQPLTAIAHAKDKNKDTGSTSSIWDNTDEETRGIGGYLSHALQAREVNAEGQRKRAMLRVLKKIKDDAEESARRQREEDAAKDAHRQAMEIKAAQLREKTLLRVSKLKSDKVESEEMRRTVQSQELSNKLERASVTQSEDYQQKMLKMRKETQKRLQQVRLEEEARRSEESKVMNKKLSDIADARRRVDREAPKGFVPPAHTHVVARQARTASPKSSTRVSNSNEYLAALSESRDDATAGRKPQPRATSPIVSATNSPPFAARSPRAVTQGYVGWKNEQTQNIQGFAAPSKSEAIDSRKAFVPPKFFNRAEDDDLSDDSLGNPPDEVVRKELPKSNIPTRAINSSAFDDNISVITFDSPTRTGKNVAAGQSADIGDVKVVKKKKTFKPLRPLAIQEYTKIPLPA